MIKFSSTIAFQHDSIFSPFKADEFEDAIRWAAASGLDGVELVISDYSDLPRFSLLELRRKLDDSGLLVSTISTGGAYHREGLNLTSAEETVRKNAFRRVCEHIEAAEILGSKVTIGLLRGVGSKTNLSEERKWLAQQLTEIDDYAARHGVGVLVEAINRYEVKLLNSLAETVHFINELEGVRSVKVLWDVFHANIEDRAFCDEIDHHIDHIGHVHFADNNRSFPGFGKFDFNGILSCLSKNKFDGFVSFECLNVPDADTVRKGMKGFLLKAQECLFAE